MATNRSQSPQVGNGGNGNNHNNRNNRNNSNSNSSNNGNNKTSQKNVTCNQCKKPGHKAAECFFNPANANKQQNNQQKDQQNKKKDAILPRFKGPHDECDLHQGKGHTNEQCSDNKNIHGQNFGRKNSESKQSAAIYKNQTYVPYCERCNKADHDTKCCNNPAVSAQCVLQCSLCSLQAGEPVKGHQRINCNNPKICRNCEKKGHSVANCREAKRWEQKLAESRPGTDKLVHQDVRWHRTIGSSHVTEGERLYNQGQKKIPTGEDQFRDYYRSAVLGQGADGQPAWSPFRCAWGIGLEAPAENADGFQNFNVGTVSYSDLYQNTLRHYPGSVNKNAVTWAWTAAGLIPKVGGVEDKQTQHIRELINAENAKSRREIADKIYQSRQLYSWKNINDEILAGEKVVPATVKAIEEGRKNTDGYSNSGLETLKYWADNRTFHTAAGLITEKGWTFIRDPTLMEHIARENKVVCNRCETTAYFYNERFQLIDPMNTDVRELVDESDWGVMLAFPCTCCTKGYTFVGAADVMDLD